VRGSRRRGARLQGEVWRWASSSIRRQERALEIKHIVALTKGIYKTYSKLDLKRVGAGGVLVESVVRGGGASSSSHPPKRGDLLVAVDTQDVRWETLQVH
jgi:hypothetical protein